MELIGALIELVASPIDEDQFSFLVGGQIPVFPSKAEISVGEDKPSIRIDHEPGGIVDDFKPIERPAGPERGQCAFVRTCPRAGSRSIERQPKRELVDMQRVPNGRRRLIESFDRSDRGVVQRDDLERLVLVPFPKLGQQLEPCRLLVWPARANMRTTTLPRKSVSFTGLPSRPMASISADGLPSILTHASVSR